MWCVILSSPRFCFCHLNPRILVCRILLLLYGIVLNSFNVHVVLVLSDELHMLHQQFLVLHSHFRWMLEYLEIYLDHFLSILFNSPCITILASYSLLYLDFNLYAQVCSWQISHTLTWPTHTLVGSSQSSGGTKWTIFCGWSQIISNLITPILFTCLTYKIICAVWDILKNFRSLLKMISTSKYFQEMGPLGQMWIL